MPVEDGDNGILRQGDARRGKPVGRAQIYRGREDAQHVSSRVEERISEDEGRSAADGLRLVIAHRKCPRLPGSLEPGLFYEIHRF